MPRLMLVVAKEVRAEKDQECDWLERYMDELGAQIKPPGKCK